MTASPSAFADSSKRRFGVVTALGCAAAATMLGACRPSASAPGEVKMGTSSEAAAVVARARRLQAAPLPDGMRLPGRRHATSATSVLAGSSAEARIAGATIHADLAARTSAMVDVSYPTRALHPRAMAVGAGAMMAVTLRDATDAPAEYADGYLVYRGTRAGADLIVRPSEHGFEDYFFFEKRPATSRVDYQLALPAAVAGLRLSSNVLELVARDGTPLAHASSPFLVDAAGNATRATLSVTGCAYDASAQPTWHRSATPAGATSCTVSVSWDDAHVQYPALLDPAWETAAAMPVTGFFSTVDVLAGRSPQQIVVSGFYGNSGAQQTTLFFDVESKTWSVGPPSVIARAAGTGVSFNNTSSSDGAQLFVSGGYTMDASGNWNLEASTEILSLDANGQWAWRSAAPMRAVRSSHTAIAIPGTAGHEILLIGGIGVGPYANGCDVGPTARTAELFDTATGTFVDPAPPDLPAPLWGAQAALAADGQTAIVMSGYNGGVDSQAGGYCSGSSLVLAYRNGAWVTLSSLPLYRIDPIVARLPDGRFLATGGYGYTDATPQTCEMKSDSQVFTYDPATGAASWATADPLPSPITEGQLATLANGAVLLAGAASGPDCDHPATPIKQVELFDPASGHWSRTADSAQPHAFGGVVPVTKTTGEPEAVAFGGEVSYDASTGWTDTAVTELLTLDPLGAACVDGTTCASGSCVDGKCQGSVGDGCTSDDQCASGFCDPYHGNVCANASFITFDATALTQKSLLITTGGGGKLFDTSNVLMIPLPAGGYTLQVYSGLLSDVSFMITADGKVDYDPSLEGVLSGRGTSELVVHGRPIRIETELSQTAIDFLLFGYPQFATHPYADVVLLPVRGYSFLLGSSTLSNFSFDVDVAGHVHIPAIYTGFAGGEGTSVLSLYGFPITVTAAPGIPPLVLFNLIGDVLPLSNLRTNTLHLLPVNPGAGYLLELNDGEIFSFNIDLGGHLLIDPSMDPYLAGAGTAALYVRHHVSP